MNLTTTTKTVAQLKRDDVVLASCAGTFDGTMPMRVFDVDTNDFGDVIVALATGWESIIVETTLDAIVQFIGNGDEFTTLWF